MKVEVIKSDRGEFEVKIDDITVAEILRVYLNKVSGVDFAAWRQDHPSNPAFMKIIVSGKSAKKAVGEAVAAINKDTSAILKVLKK